MAMPYPSRPSESPRRPFLLGRFPHPIGVYGHLPQTTSTHVDVFESATAHRLRVLHFLDEKYGLDTSTNPSVLRTPAAVPAAAAAAAAGPAAAATKPLYVQLEEMLQEGGLMLSPAAAATATEQQRQEVAERDAVSHFALRIAFSRDKEKQHWFILQESRLLIYRFDMMAYVPDTELDAVICGKLRFKNVRLLLPKLSALSQSFELLEGRQATLQNTVFSDSRVGKLLSAAPTVYLGRDFSKAAPEATEERLTPQTIKHVWKDSFPPCMRRLYESYMADHHLRHGGRMQLWLFFKGAGMTLEENLQFNRQVWREPQKFDKEHAYNVRHMYGLEGKRTSYAPMRCSQIIGGGMLGAPGTGDYHGCPLKHFDTKRLQKLLEDWGLNYKQAHAVLRLKESGDYQLACKEYFLQTHPGSAGDDVGNHPNAFFAASRRSFAAAASGAAAAAANAAAAKGQQQPATAAADAESQEGDDMPA